MLIIILKHDQYLTYCDLLMTEYVMLCCNVYCILLSRQICLIKYKLIILDLQKQRIEIYSMAEITILLDDVI